MHPLPPPPPPTTPPGPSFCLPFRLAAFGSCLAGLGGIANVDDDPPPRLPFPLLNLFCVDDRVSGADITSFTGVQLLPRPLFPRPFGVLISKSLVGDSQNLGSHRQRKKKKNDKHINDKSYHYEPRFEKNTARDLCNCQIRKQRKVTSDLKSITIKWNGEGTSNKV